MFIVKLRDCKGNLMNKENSNKVILRYFAFKSIKYDSKTANLAVEFCF